MGRIVSETFIIKFILIQHVCEHVLCLRGSPTMQSPRDG
jgi:hypothetical protein